TSAYYGQGISGISAFTKTLLETITISETFIKDSQRSLTDPVSLSSPFKSFYDFAQSIGRVES
ncbi:hypothetical protein LCGC14_1487020, partial [marine sediment metagenome]